VKKKKRGTFFTVFLLFYITCFILLSIIVIQSSVYEIFQKEMINNMSFTVISTK